MSFGLSISSQAHSAVFQKTTRAALAEPPMQAATTTTAAARS